MTHGNGIGAPVIVGRRPVLVTGGAGFIGSNIADRLAHDGRDVIVYDALARPGVEINLEWLKLRHPRRITSVVADIRDEGSISAAAAEASAVFHLAAQVAVTTSLLDPRDDFETNIRGTLNLLEALRKRRDHVPLIFASTNKVYGDLADIELDKIGEAYVPSDAGVRSTGIGETRPLDFHTPYGCSKGAADQYVLDYARSYGVPTCVLRMSCIYGQRQMGTEDQGWVAHFLLKALRGETIDIYGDGCQVRDVLDINDAVNAYMAALDRIESVRGRAFNLGGGPSNAISLKQLLTYFESLLGRRIDVKYSGWRAGDQRYYVSDTRLATRELGLRAPTPWRQGVDALARWLKAEREPAPAARSLAPARVQVQ